MAKKEATKTYINHHTGEMFDGVDVSFSNLCEGYADERFKKDLELLVSRMYPGDKGAINIKVKVEKLINDKSEQVVEITVDSSIHLPKSSMRDAILKNIDSSGQLVEVIDNQSLFPAGSEDLENV